MIESNLVSENRSIKILYHGALFFLLLLVKLR